MKNVIRITVALVLIGLGVWLWLYLHPSPEVAIRRRLAEVAKTVSFSGQEGMISRAARSQKFADYFGKEVTLHIDLPEGTQHEAASRDEIAKTYMWLRWNFRTFTVEFLDPNITLGPDRKSAILEVTVRAATSSEKYFIVQELRLTMREVEGEWLILRVETIKTLS
jgi:hypothetical protein